MSFLSFLKHTHYSNNNQILNSSLIYIFVSKTVTLSSSLRPVRVYQPYYKLNFTFTFSNKNSISNSTTVSTKILQYFFPSFLLCILIFDDVFFFHFLLGRRSINLFFPLLPKCAMQCRDVLCKERWNEVHASSAERNWFHDLVRFFIRTHTAATPFYDIFPRIVDGMFIINRTFFYFARLYHNISSWSYRNYLAGGASNSDEILFSFQREHR